MTDRLKALEQDRDSKAQRAEELHTQWKAACKEAGAARDAYISASKSRLQGKQLPPVITSPSQSPINPPAPAVAINYRQCCEGYKERANREANEITKHEMRAALGRIRLEQLELSLHECQQGESPILIQDELRPHDVVAFWIEKLLATYRDNRGYTGNTSAELYRSELDRSALCHIAADLVNIIAGELMENLKVIETMKNREGMLTTPGNIEGSLWYLICKQRGIDLSTKSVKERPAVIREALNQWPMDNSFQESNRIMRHWAALTHTQRSAGGKATQPIVTKATKEEIRAEYRRNPGKSVQDFCDRLTNEGRNLPDKRTIERYTKDLRQKK
ncbi:hypothetical protein S922_09085 [Salmonella enterica subsp. enterica]|nr:hypothetical protein [Salmonella enterica subsp. enterica]